MPTPAAMPAMEGVAPELLPDKDKIYFNDYATLVQQQGMLQDSVRTSIYQFAVLENRSDFEGKRVMDVGAGTGILSFFAARGGASTVYAVEASLMAHKAGSWRGGLGGVVKVLNQRVEEVSLDVKVDVLISSCSASRSTSGCSSRTLRRATRTSSPAARCSWTAA